MLNPFPELLSFGLIAPFILRIILGYLFINVGYLKITSEKKRWQSFFEGIKLKPASFFVKFFGFVEIIAGVMLVIGLFTQITALILAILTFGELYIEFKEESLLKRNLVFYLLIFTISLSLIFSGAGFFAFDLSV
ncbi:MAG: DoxX family protein [Patescibacteria group bacterium]